MNLAELPYRGVATLVLDYADGGELTFTSIVSGWCKAQPGACPGEQDNTRLESPRHVTMSLSPIEKTRLSAHPWVTLIFKVYAASQHACTGWPAE